MGQDALGHCVVSFQAAGGDVGTMQEMQGERLAEVVALGAAQRWR